MKGETLLFWIFVYGGITKKYFGECKMNFQDFFINFVFTHSAKSQPVQKIPGFGKKLSQELRTSGSPKVDRLVTYMCRRNDQL